MVVGSGKAMDVPGKALERLALTRGRVLIRARRREPIRSSFPALQGSSGQRSRQLKDRQTDRQKTGLGQWELGCAGLWILSSADTHSALVSF